MSNQSKNSKSNDQDLIAKIIKKDERALLSFYKQYSQVVCQYICRQIKDRSIAEEITQDVFLDFIEDIRDFRGESSIKTFIFTIAHNKVIDYIRKKKIKKILFSAIPSFIVERLATVLIDDQIEKKELAKKIDTVLRKLPNDYHLILRLKYIEEEKVGKIASKLALSFKATESLLFRARKAFINVFRNTV